MSEQQVRATINQKLIESGEKERLKDMLRSKLVECGWRDEMKVHCKEIIKQKGVENVHVEDLVEEVIPKGRGSFLSFFLQLYFFSFLSSLLFRLASRIFSSLCSLFSSTRFSFFLFSNACFSLLCCSHTFLPT
ncbi:Transcription and mRNA export factor eny2, variant 2 [Balamuthia mandrillaris]